MTFKSSWKIDLQEHVRNSIYLDIIKLKHAGALFHYTYPSRSMGCKDFP